MSNLDLAVIGNCRTAALIDRRGRIVWWCVPRFDGDPVFASLLMADSEPPAGFCDVEMVGQATASQGYRVNTAILETILTDDEGRRLRITDFAPRFKQYQRIYRPMTVIRRIEPLDGLPVIRVRLRPVFDYGRVLHRPVYGSNHLRYASDGIAIRLTTDIPISYIAEETRFQVDRPLYMLIGNDESLLAPIAETARDFLDRTEDYWFEWSRYLSVPFEWQDAVIRSAITLKLCEFEETGGVVAALTTSIPESPEGGRTWDYRFCWPRDAYFTVHALNRLGATRTMEDYIRYICNVAAGETNGDLKPVHALVPGVALPEQLIAELSGYRGIGPVRVGNAARDQIQNDGYGSVVLAATQMFFDQRLPKRGDEALYRQLEVLGRHAVRTAFVPDSGLWEYRTRESVHTYSSALCWAACDRLARIAQVLGLAEEREAWAEHARAIREVVLERGFNPGINSFVDTFEGEDVDASLLLLQEIGLVAADDPRFLGTLERIERDLLRNGLLLRYATRDDFGLPSSAFTSCTFWYIDALVAVGRAAEARALFERVLAYRNHVGLLSEDLDPETGELWGNFPQTYSMVGLIVSAMRLSRSWEEGFWRGS